MEIVVAHAFFYQDLEGNGRVGASETIFKRSSNWLAADLNFASTIGSSLGSSRCSSQTADFHVPTTFLSHTLRVTKKEKEGDSDEPASRRVTYQDTPLRLRCKRKRFMHSIHAVVFVVLCTGTPMLPVSFVRLRVSGFLHQMEVSNFFLSHA